jgi:hypothetical protein
MTTKLLEIRDVGTTMSTLAIRLDGVKSEPERWLLARAGFGLEPDDQAGSILLLNLTGSSGEWSCDPYQWTTTRARTLVVAQRFINEHFDTIESGDVVDVEFILGERAVPKVSDRFYAMSKERD